MQNIVKNELSSQHLTINFNPSESIEQLLPQTNLLILHYLLSHIHKHTTTGDKNGKNYNVNFDTHLNPKTICEKSLIFSDNLDISLYNEGVSECNSAFVILKKTGGQ